MTSRKIKFNVIFDHTEICYKTIKSEWSKEKNKSKKNSATKYVHFMKVGLEHLKNNAPISKKDSIVAE